MSFDQYLTDEQDPKTAEKVIGKLRDMLTGGEAILYLSVQKKPAVTISPDCIAVTNKRLVFYMPENLGLTANFIVFLWADIQEINFREEFFGAKVNTVPVKGASISIDYIPKAQARKLYQIANEQLENHRREVRKQEETAKQVTLQQSAPAVQEPMQAEFSAPQFAAPEDEITQKLKKLKLLFERQLITQEEYEAKKADILSQF